MTKLERDPSYLAGDLQPHPARAMQKEARRICACVRQAWAYSRHWARTFARTGTWSLHKSSWLLWGAPLLWNWEQLAIREDFPSLEAGEELVLTEHCYACPVAWGEALHCKEWSPSHRRVENCLGLVQSSITGICTAVRRKYFTPPEGINCFLIMLGSD